jgi:AraC-like DNA-binding protein
MLKRGQPAVDRELEGQSGRTRDGQPISYNRAPSPDLAPWIARLYVTEVSAPADHVLHCGLFNETSFIRIQTKGRWTAHTADGAISYEKAALAFGPHTRRMPISVIGSFNSVGVSLCAGTGHALTKVKAPSYLDRMVPATEWSLPGEAALAIVDKGGGPEAILDELEVLIRHVIDRAGGHLPDPISARFEAICFSNSSMTIAQIARDCDIDQRRLERIVKRDFGMPPKQVLRRARALDMASQLRGVADYDEADEQALRFYDQSHLIREFVDLFGMTPGQFVTTPQPILTSALESRQARRLEVLKRLVPGEARPWQGTVAASQNAT